MASGEAVFRKFEQRWGTTYYKSYRALLRVSFKKTDTAETLRLLNDLADSMEDALTPGAEYYSAGYHVRILDLLALKVTEGMKRLDTLGQPAVWPRRRVATFQIQAGEVRRMRRSRRILRIFGVPVAALGLAGIVVKSLKPDWLPDAEIGGFVVMLLSGVSLLVVNEWRNSASKEQALNDSLPPTYRT